MDLKNLPILLLGSILLMTICQSIPLDAKKDKNWWRKSNYYQIYPRSFQDSNGDGVGDLNGIIQRLSYLKEIGIKATWLSPIFESPMVDNGYDISNFEKIDPIFGTMEDFKNLIKKAHELDIKIILDFVPNHSSDQHEWFEKSENKTAGFEDFYVWRDGDQSDPKSPKPPNNWRSVFRGSAWTWSEKRKQFYYHQFYKQQPDLNFRSEGVKRAMENVLRFWLDKGVDGFRIDAVPHIFEDKEFKDEPKNEGVTDPDDYASLIHDYTYDQNETFEIICDWRAVLDNYTQEKGGNDRIILAEAYSPMTTKMKYYGVNGRKGAQFPFNFLLIDLNDKSKADDYVGKVKEWRSQMPKDETANWVLGNHDKPRIADRLGRERTTLLNLFILSLPGISVTYYGEEIGMQNIELKPKPFYMEDDRNGERSPMQWNDEISAGFSTNSTPWLPVAPDYKYRNVKVQRGIPLSHLSQYKAMTELREKENFYENENFEIKKIGESTVHINRNYANYSIESLFNVGLVPDTIKEKIFNNGIVQIMNEHSKRRKGEKIVTTDKFQIYPNEVLIMRIDKKSN